MSLTATTSEGFQVNVHLFGPLAEVLRSTQISVRLPQGATVQELRQVLTDGQPAAGALIHLSRIAINRSLVDGSAPIQQDDEVAVIPPVSGGSGPHGGTDPVLGRLVADPIRANQTRELFAGCSKTGGIVIFEGVCRMEQDEQLGCLLHLEYEAYAPMAEENMMEMGHHAVLRWGLNRVILFHRVGRVQPTETSVWIGVASPHRDESFNACRWLIDTLKRDVPIWKKEVFEGGSRWIQPTPATQRPWAGEWTAGARPGDYRSNHGEDQSQPTGDPETIIDPVHLDSRIPEARIP